MEQPSGVTVQREQKCSLVKSKDSLALSAPRYPHSRRNRIHFRKQISLAFMQ